MLSRDAVSKSPKSEKWNPHNKKAHNFDHTFEKHKKRTNKISKKRKGHALQQQWEQRMQRRWPICHPRQGPTFSRARATRSPAAPPPERRRRRRTPTTVRRGESTVKSRPISESAREARKHYRFVVVLLRKLLDCSEQRLRWWRRTWEEGMLECCAGKWKELFELRQEGSASERQWLEARVRFEEGMERVRMVGCVREEEAWWWKRRKKRKMGWVGFG